MALSSDAGPSSAPSAGVQHDELGSLRQLYYTLEAASSTVPASAVHARLREVLPRLRSSCGTTASSSYPPSSTASKIELDDSLRDIAKRCAGLHRVDEKEMAVALRIYLDSEDAILDRLADAPDSFASPLDSRATISGRHGKARKRKAGRDDVTNTLSDALSVFYLDERLYALRCISVLLRIGDDNYHDLHDIAEDILGRFLDQDFGLKCLERMESLCREQLAEEIREVPRYSTYWAKHMLREQLALLEIVFLTFYSRIESSAHFVRAVHQTIERTDFGRRNANAGFFDAEGSALSDCVAHLFVLLAIESLDVERMVDGLNLFAPSRQKASKNADHTPLTEDADVVGAVIDYLRTSTARDYLRAPLLIAWALFVSRVDGAMTEWGEARPTEGLPAHLQDLASALSDRGGAGALWLDLASAALSHELDLFSTLRNIANSPLLSWDSRSTSVLALALPSSLAMRAVLKGLILSVTELVRPEFVQDYSGLVQIWQDTFANRDDVDHRTLGQATDSAAALCAQFWQVDYEHEQRRALLVTATRRFPVSFRPLVGLCRALSGSGPGALHTSDETLRASTAVFGYLSEVDTVTQLIPLSPAMSAPYEPTTNNDSNDTTFRAKRDIPVFGRHFVIPAGTLGRMVSADDHPSVIMVWHLVDQPYSVWRLLRDVLAQFAGLLDRKDEFSTPREAGDSAVFVDASVTADFADLAPDESGGFDGDIAAEIMDLFSCLLATESQLSTTLLSHLEGHDVERLNPAQPTALDPRRISLVATTLAILNQALAMPKFASRVIVSAYRLLTLSLATTRSDEVWLPLRSSGLLTGMNGSLSFGIRTGLMSSSATMTLLAYEMSIGNFSGLLALLDFHHALLADVQQVSFALDPSDADLKVEILLRALRFVAEQVWPDHQNWKYVRLRQRIEIGQKCVQMFLRIVSDDTLADASPAIARLHEVAEGWFTSNSAMPGMLSPVLHVIMTRQDLINGLQKGMRLVEVELAREHVQACLRLARKIVECRRRSQQTRAQDPHYALTLGLVERAFVEETSFSSNIPSASRRKTSSSIGAAKTMDLASATMSSIFTSHAHSVRCEAIKLMTAVCGALADASVAHAPALISHLGSLSDVETTVTSLLAMVDNANEDGELRALTLNLLAALISGQPGIATLLLTGKHVASGPEQDNKPEGKTIRRTAVEVAAALVESVKDGDQTRLGISELRSLEAALKLLSAAWEHAIEHRTEFEHLRKSRPFWNTLLAMACSSAGTVPTDPGQIEILQGRCQTDRDDEVIRSALIKTCSARAIHLIAVDIRIAPMLEHRAGNSKSSDQRSDPNAWPSLNCIVDLLQDQKRLLPTLKMALSIQCDPLRHVEILLRIEQTFPELSIDSFRIPSRMDDYDIEKQYGNAYVYDIDALRFKLAGLNRTSATSAGEDESMAGADAVLQATLLVAGVNLDWCVIDSQSMYLRAWTAMLSTVVGPLFDRLERDKVLAHELRRTVSRVCIDCAQIAADEEFATEIVQDIHALRMSLLAVLLETAWSVPPQKANRQLDHDFGEEERETALQIMEQSARLVTHPVLSIEDKMRKASFVGQNSLHRDAARIVLVCAGRYRALRRDLQGAKGGEAELLRGMQRCAETFVSHTITCMRIALDRCLSAISAGHSTSNGDFEAAERNLDLDLQLLAAGLAALLHRDSGLLVHTWSPKLQTSALLSTAFELFGRSPMRYHHFIDGAEGISSTRTTAPVDELASDMIPAFWQTLLDLFLDLACQESTAELMILAGAVNALSMNALSMALEGAPTDSARIPPRLATGPSENALHGQWIKMLRVIIALINAMNGPHRQVFVQHEVTSFFRIFYSALESSLDRALFNATAIGIRRFARQNDGTRMATVVENVTLNQLRETDLTLKLVLHVFRVQLTQDELSTDVDRPAEQARVLMITSRQQVERLISSFVGRATLRLQEAVHLLQHPHELLAILGLDRGDHASRSSPQTTSANYVAIRHLVQISISLVECFWLFSQGLETLSSTDASDWDLDCAMIAPTIGTAPSRPSSIGTLLDLSSSLMDALRSLGGITEKDGSSNITSAFEGMDIGVALISALEQTLSLATTQLAIAMHGRTRSTVNVGDAESRSLAKSARIQSIEVEAGLGRDVSQSTDSARAAIQAHASHTTSERGRSGSATAYYDVLLSFQRRWLLASE